MNKDQLLKSLDYLYNLPPSKWNLAFVTRVKVKLLPHIIKFVKEPEESEESKKSAKFEKTEKTEKTGIEFAKELFLNEDR